MMNRTSPVRKHTRFPVRWAVVYGCEGFLGEGTVLDVTRIGWRMAGVMPVQPGMRLTLQLWPEGKPDRMRVEATVLWVNGCEFALDKPKLTADDHAWISEFLNQKLSLSLMPDAMSHVSSEAEHRDRFEREETGKTAERDLTQLQEEIVIRCIDSIGRGTTPERTTLHHVHQDALRLVNGIRHRIALRQRTGQGWVTNN